jgi:hypothetical protein
VVLQVLVKARFGLSVTTAESAAVAAALADAA